MLYRYRQGRRTETYLDRHLPPTRRGPMPIQHTVGRAGVGARAAVLNMIARNGSAKTASAPGQLCCYEMDGRVKCYPCAQVRAVGQTRIGGVRPQTPRGGCDVVRPECLHTSHCPSGKFCDRDTCTCEPIAGRLQARDGMPGRRVPVAKLRGRVPVPRGSGCAEWCHDRAADFPSWQDCLDECSGCWDAATVQGYDACMGRLKSKYGEQPTRPAGPVPYVRVGVSTRARGRGGRVPTPPLRYAKLGEPLARRMPRPRGPEPMYSCDEDHPLCPAGMRCDFSTGSCERVITTPGGSRSGRKGSMLVYSETPRRVGGCEDPDWLPPPIPRLEGDRS